MRFLTPTESRLLADLPLVEADVLRTFFEELDARLVDGEAPTDRGPLHGSVESMWVPQAASSSKPSGASPSTSQSVLFPMHKKEARP